MTHSISLILHGFIRFKGNLTTPLSSSSSSSSSRLGLQLSPQSRYQKLTNLDHALYLFDEMIQRRPLPSVVKFTQLLNSVTKMNHFSSCLHLFKQMCAIGVPVDAYSISIAIKCCCSMSRTNDGFALLGCCFRRAVVPNVYIFNTLLNGLVVEDRILEAERLFKKLIKHKLCEPDVVTYNTMIKGLCRVGNNDIAVGLLRLMDERGCKPKMNHFSSCLHLFKQMCAIGVPVNKYSMSIVIKCCCHLYRTNDGFALLGCCFKRAVVPDEFVFNTLLDGLILEDRIVDAERLFKKLIKHRLCELSVVTYNTMIKGLCKFGNNVAAIGLLRLMDERSCKPNVVTYSTIIDSLCKDKMIDDAFKLFNEMVFAKGIQPDVITYTSLIYGLCNLCRWDEVSKQLKEMEDVSISPDLQTFSILVDAFCKAGRVDEAEAVVKFFVERGEVPNIVTYNSLINGYCLRGEMTKARALFDSLTSKGLIPDVITYSSLLNGYCKSLKLEEAMHMFHEITRKGLKPNIVTYSTMIQGLFRVGRCGDAWQLFDGMQAQGQTPNECTYRIILDGLCSNYQLVEALSLFRSVGDSSRLNSDIIVYNILIDGAGNCGKLDIARALFHELHVKGVRPNVWTYNAMIHGFCRKGLLREAKNLFLKMGERDCPPDNLSYCVLLHGYLKHQHFDDVEILLQQLDRRSYSLDASTLLLLKDRIIAGSLDRSLLKLIGRLVPKELMDSFTGREKKLNGEYGL